MKELYCIDCDHVFAGNEGDHCDTCGSEHTEVLPPDWGGTEGHFEGGFSSSGTNHEDEE